MRRRLLWAAFFVVAIALGGGCTAHTSPVAGGIPVRRLPDEVLYNSACQPNCDAIPLAGANKAGPIRPVKADAPAFPEPELPPGVACTPAGGCAPCAVFYTGGALGSGQYPLKCDLRVTEAVAVARGPLASGGCSSPSRVHVLRRLATGQQLNIRVDLNEALRDPRENIPIWPGDMIILQGTTCGAFGRIFHHGQKFVAGNAACVAVP